MGHRIFLDIVGGQGFVVFFLLSDPHWWSLGHRNFLKTTAGKKRLGTSEKLKDHLGPIGF